MKKFLILLLVLGISLPAMSQTVRRLQLRRGVCAQLPTLADAEPAWCEDTQELWMGTNTLTNVKITGASGIGTLNGQNGASQIFANDTNVSITSSANTHTLGWLGTLSVSRGGTSNALTPILGGIVYSDATKLNILAAGTSGQVLQSNGTGTPSWSSFTGLTSLNLQTGSTQVFANDTNVIVTSSANTHSLGWAGTLGVSRGGTSNALVPVLGGVIYTDATKLNVLGAGVSGQFLTSSGAGVPSWSFFTLNGQAGNPQIFANDTNITITSASNTHTLGWSGTLDVSRGGTSAALTPSFGAVAYSTASTLALSSVGTSGQFLQSTGAGTPIWASVSAITSLNSQTGATQIFANDTNVVITSASNTHTLGWSGTLTVARGGTGHGAYTGGSIIYSDGTVLQQQNANLFWDGTNHRLGINQTSPTARIHLPGVSAAAGSAPIKLTSGTLMTVAEAGAIENDGTNLYYTKNTPTRLIVAATATTPNGAVVYTDGTSAQVTATGTSGQFLQSVGAGTPTWAAAMTSLNGAVGTSQVFANDTNVVITTATNTHTLGWSGTLSVARGGTGNSAFTSGSIPFSNGTILTQNNGNFFWDGTNSRLGIGTASPTARLHLPAGSINASTAPLKLTSGSNLTVTEAGAVEYDGTNLFFSTSTPVRERVLSFGAGATVNLGGVVYQNSTTHIGQTAAGTAGQVLLSGGAGAPTWGQLIHDAEVSITGVVSAEDSEWITGNCVLAASIYTCTLTTFATTPKCICSVHGVSLGVCIVNPTSNTSVAIATATNPGGGGVDHAFTLRCAAP